MTGQVATGAPLTLTDGDLLPLRPWRHAERDPDHPSFSRWADGAWRTVTAGEHLDALVAAACGLIASGVAAGDRVALMSDTRYEWLLLDEAIWNVGAGTVPVYPSSSASQLEWIVTDSAARLLVVETREQADLAAGLDIEVLVIDQDALGELDQRGHDVARDEVIARRDAITFDDLAGLVYTSGTTGRPKGVVLTHRHLGSEVAGLLAAPIGSVGTDGNRILLFLPMAHVLARSVAYVIAQSGATLGFWSDFGTITSALGTFRPHMVLGVPRVFEKVHEGIRAAAAGGRLSSAVFTRGAQVAIAWSRACGDDLAPKHPGLGLRAAHAVFDRLLYAKVRAALGDECEYAISGGGALGERLGHFFRGVGVPVHEGYGLTETCAAITVNGPGIQRIGTVGPPVPGNEVRVTDAGEIEVRGAIVTDGYWGNEEATRASIVDGWFRTGDLGSLDEQGYLTITGRAKEIIVTAGGKNVSPGQLEDVLRSHPLVSHAMVLGDGRPFISALITLDPTQERPADPQAELQGVVDEANALVSKAEGIKRFAVLDEDFTEESGELTATQKLKRHVIEERHADVVGQLYTKR
ncbi:AMP-dependent synthetase/ligase [Janibacter anophelis]|uniref:AMP-dependent synthetase/ligase n=1 Tax=Janibacter anophelis TaxID=319054 RepID=UPI0008296D16|nr:long-chain fatty acid--CoA ligase [Janibacter anophelis]